jgi:ComF family protein
MDAVREALFPSKCLLCGDFFEALGAPTPLEKGRFETALAGWLCTACQMDHEAIVSPLCPRCGLPFISPEVGDHLCGDCRTRPGAFDRARAVGHYAGALKALILQFKFHGQVGLAQPLGRLLLDAFLHHWPAGDVDLILPVPLHQRRMRRRGYNQAYLLVRHWPLWYEALNGVPLACHIERDLLRRVRPTTPQTGLNRGERERNLNRAFALAGPLPAKGLRILLVDDVLTTGATVNACARMLSASGAGRVEVLTLARAF